MNNTDTLRKNIEIYGIGRIKLFQEAPCSSAPSNFGYTYITYSRLPNLSGTLIKPASNTAHFGRISALASSDDYSYFGDHIPIPCHDFILKSVIDNEQFFYLIRRRYWPMNSAWWPVGGRRVLPCILDDFREDWCLWDEVYWKLQADLGLFPDSIVGVQELARSDHYHICFKDGKFDQIVRRRVTPVTTYLIEIENTAMCRILKPKTEASAGNWFSEYTLKEQLMKCDQVMSYPDHLRVLFSSVLNHSFPLTAYENDNNERSAA